MKTYFRILMVLFCILFCFTGCQNEQETDYRPTTTPNNGIPPDMWKFHSFSQIREFAAAANEGEYAFRTFIGESDTGLWENNCYHISTALSFVNILKNTVLPYAEVAYRDTLITFEYRPESEWFAIMYVIDDIRYYFQAWKNTSLEYDENVTIEKEVLFDEQSIGLFYVPETKCYAGILSCGEYSVWINVWADDIEKISFSYFSLGTLEEFLSDENLYFSNPQFDFNNMDAFMAFFIPDAQTNQIPAVVKNHLNGSSDTPVSDIYTAFINEMVTNKKVHIPSKSIEQIRLYSNYRHGKPWICYFMEQESGLSAKIYIAYLTPEEKTMAENVTFEEFLYAFDSEYLLMYGFGNSYVEEIQLADRSVSALIRESADQNACYVYFVYDNLLVNVELDKQQPDMEWLKTLSFAEYTKQN